MISKYDFLTIYYSFHRRVEKIEGILKTMEKTFVLFIKFLLRIILQMSVWQDYLLSLAYVYPTSDIQTEITDRVFQLLKLLLYHAIKFEYGGWRVWIDTLSILHGRVTIQLMKFDRFVVRFVGVKRRLLQEDQ